MENVKAYMRQVGQAARAASRLMALADTAAKNRALEAMALAILEGGAQLIAANAKDVAAAQASGLDAAAIDRLTLTEKSVRGMAEGCSRSRNCPT